MSVQGGTGSDHPGRGHDAPRPALDVGSRRASMGKRRGPEPTDDDRAGVAASAGSPSSPRLVVTKSQADLDTHPSWAQCAECGRTFLNDTGFEAHRAGPTTERECLIPPGYVQERGLWGTPEGFASLKASSERLAVARSHRGDSEAE